MKKYLRIASLLLALLSVASFMGSCGSETEEKGTETEAGTAAVTEKAGDDTAALTEAKAETAEQTEDPGDEEEDMTTRNIIIGLNYTIGADAGDYSAKSSRFATESYIALAEFEKISISVYYKMTWIAYDASYKYLGNSGKFLGESKKWLVAGESITSESVLKAAPDAAYIRIAVCHSSSKAAFTAANLTESCFTITAKPKFRLDVILPELPAYQYKNLVTGDKYSFQAEQIGSTEKYQDGAIYGTYMIRLSNKGEYRIYTLGNGVTEIFAGTLDCADSFVPHSNSVSFGTQKYSESDEFPLLYCNIYNNYKNETDRQEGTCCVYRLTRDGTQFSTELVQILKIGFTGEKGLWISENVSDIRPYGNFVCDRTNGKLYVFVPLDEQKITRIFTFVMPDVSKSTTETTVGSKKIKTLTLSKSDITSQFDVDYISYPQGTTVCNGILYSLEGFNHEADTRAEPALKMFDLEAKKLIADIPLYSCGLSAEPEFIAYSGTYGLVFSDRTGIVYKIQLNKK